MLGPLGLPVSDSSNDTSEPQHVVPSADDGAVTSNRSESSSTYRLRGGALLVVGVLSTFLMMANEGRLPHGPLFGMLTMGLAGVGLIDLFGLWRAAPSTHAGADLKTRLFEAREGEPAWSAPKWGVMSAVFVLTVGAILFGYQAMPVAVLLAVLSLLPAALFRPGLLLFVLVGVVYLPMLGAYGLWDPWETHYGEVAREILSRDDWISLWWAQDGYFWSKPILIFWVEALSMGALGVDYLPDANPAHPEWAIRLPIIVMTFGALMAVYAAVKRYFGARAGLLSGLVLASMPYFFFLSHQAITDMPFVANMTIAVCFLLLSLGEPADREVRSYRVASSGRWASVHVTGQQLVVALIFLVVTPQILYLASRNVSLVEGFRFAVHPDGFLHGSAGNAGVPGNAALRDATPVFSGAFAQPIAQALYWLLGLVGLLFLVLRERRTQALFMYAFYVFCGIAFMGKGIPGFALPGLVALLFLLSTGRWSHLVEGRFRVAPGILTVLLVGMPWFVAMYMRHGTGFTDRLLIHDHINRLAAGVHGDKGTVGYFIEQLGFGLFPWIGLVPLGLTAFFWYRERAGEDISDAQRDERKVALTVTTLWFAAAFTLFSAMITKFHHYIFPAVPPAAIVTGVMLDRLWPRLSVPPERRKLWASMALLALGLATLVLGIGAFWGDLRGVIPEEALTEQDWVLRAGPSTWVASLVTTLGALFVAASYWLQRSTTRTGGSDAEALAEGATPSDADGAFERSVVPMLLAGVGAGALLLAFVGRDLSWMTTARPHGFERLIHLFVYKYERDWPQQFDYRPILTGFAFVATLAVAAMMVRRVRHIAVASTVALGLLFSAWTLNVYMIDLSPHWGQRELIKRYYEERESADEPLLAFQMNWKGENFYSGNRVAAFVKLDNTALKKWADENKGRRAFILLEHKRLGNFRGVLSGRQITEITTKLDCNKFVLVETTL